MSEASSICLLLGSASAEPSSADSKVIKASSAQEIAESRNGLPPASLGMLEVVVNGSDIGSLYVPMELANWSSSLKADASVSIRIVGEAPAASLKTIHTSFLLAGLASKSERREDDSTRVLTAAKKTVSTASAAPIQKKTTGPAVTISLDDNDDGLIDEDDLLNDENTLLAPPPAMSANRADDCSGRKPCDDCTCGRADALTTANNNAPKQAPSSSCGKCSMGDAFRCASCPYLGKPAFKAGEEHLVLNLADDF